MKTINLKTSIPGPKSQALAERSAQAVARGIAQLTPIFVARAEGACIEDVDGNRFIDFAGGIGCLNVGHRNPEVTAALHDQTDRFLHTCFMVTPYESYVALAEKLNALAPGSSPKKTILVNTGAEAVENAIKIARAYTRRPAVICFEDGFFIRAHNADDGGFVQAPEPCVGFPQGAFGLLASGGLLRNIGENHNDRGYFTRIVG